MIGMGYEDVDLKRRVARRGQVEDVDSAWVGFSPPSTEEEKLFPEGEKHNINHLSHHQISSRCPATNPRLRPAP